MAYLVVSNFLLLVFYAFYRWKLHRLTFFNRNRWYLLFAVLGACLLPLPLLFHHSLVSVELPLIDLDQPLGVPSEVASIAGSLHHWKARWGDDISLIYWSGVGLGLLLFVYRLVVQLRRIEPTDAYHSYTFFSQVHLGERIRPETMIQQHEKLHAQSGHSYDLLFVEIAQLLNWFNPVFYGLKRDLKLQHEYWVDEHFSGQRVAYAEKLVNYAMHVPESSLVSTFSNHSVLKARIRMLFSEKSCVRQKRSYFLIIPTALLVYIFVMLLAAYARSGLMPPSAAGKVYSFNELESAPEYPGGFDTFRGEIATHLHYPKAAERAQIQGRIEISFVVNPYGQLEDVQLLNDLGYGLGEAVIQSVLNTKRWKPGQVNGKPVSVRYLLPMRVGYSVE